MYANVGVYEKFANGIIFRQDTIGKLGSKNGAIIVDQR
jgi:hypothetical protein